MLMETSETPVLYRVRCRPRAAVALIVVKLGRGLMVLPSSFMLSGRFFIMPPAGMAEGALSSTVGEFTVFRIARRVRVLRNMRCTQGPAAAVHGFVSPTLILVTGSSIARHGGTLDRRRSGQPADLFDVELHG
jgi:hypothetical protein